MMKYDTYIFGIHKFQLLRSQNCDGQIGNFIRYTAKLCTCPLGFTVSPVCIDFWLTGRVQNWNFPSRDVKQ